ncbi:MAG: hypothetical protein M3P94_01475 [Chloroflexota bacterium]|nr:hypothetical protein [Chloroflexota bacterium]
MRRSEIQLVKRATSGRWPIPDELRPMLVADLAATALAAESDRERTNAAKVLLAMDGQNLEQERRDQKIPTEFGGQQVVIYLPDNGRDPRDPAPARPADGVPL